MPQDQVFISYSHKDRDFLEDLETSLKPYLRHGSVKSWSDERITPGSKWLPQITSALINTKVAVLLVSPDFIASDFIYEQELGPLLKAAEQGGVKILWVPVRASGYKKTGLKDIQAVLDPAQPLANMTNAERDQAWVKICEEIEKAVEDFTELDLSEAGQAIAWECLRNNFWPEPISLTAAIQAIRDEDVDRRNRIAATVFMQAPGQLASYVPEPMTEERARKLLDNLTNRDLLQSLSNGTMKIATSSNALIWGSYYQLDRLGNERALWENLVTNARQKLQEAGTKEDRNRIVDFILAVRSTGERNAERLKIPHALLDELGELASCQPFTEVQECFANFVRRWAVPEGIGPLEQTAARQGSSVRITKRNGRVIRLESINGSGALVPRIELSYLRSESSPPEQQTECRLEFSYDESGNVSWEEASDPVGRLLYRCAYSPAPPSAQVAPGQHQTTARYFIDNSDVASPRTRSGASFVRITRDAKGFDQRWEYLDGLGRPQPDELSRFGQEAENGDLGLPIRLTCLGPDLTPAVCSPGYAMADFTYDERGNKTSQSYFDIAAKPVTQSEGYHKATFSWDTRGNWIGVRLFGLNGESIIHTDGFAGWDATYDEAGNQTGQTYLDTQNKPAPIKAGYASWTGTHDARGNLVDQSYLDALGVPTPTRDGVIRAVVQYDDSGNVVDVAYRDAAGNAAADLSGVSHWTRRSDERRHAIAEFYFGLDGQRMRNKDGYAGYLASYDAKGNQTELVYLGPDGQPDWCSLGFARQQTRYDIYGNRIEERFFAPAGEPAEDSDGIHRKVHTYNEHGKLVITRFFDAKGLPALREGYSICTWLYDNATGNVIRREYRDASGRLTLHCDGYAIELLRYDSCGRQIEARYLDPAEQPIASAQGYAGWTARYDSRGLAIQRSNLDAKGNEISGWIAFYDARGNCLETRYVGPSGEPALSADGIAAIVYRYDARDNRAQEDYFGLAGERVSLASGVAKIAWKYDSRNNPIEQIYHNTADHPMIHAERGYASWKAVYDTRNNRVEQQFFGADGQSVRRGFVRILTQYDDRSRPIHERKFTANDVEYFTRTDYDPLKGRKEVFHSPQERIVSHYDRAGRQIREAWFQLDNSPKMARLNEIAFSRWEASYDSCGRLTGQLYYDDTSALVHRVEFAYDDVGTEIAKTVQDRQDDHWQITKTARSSQGQTIEVRLAKDDRSLVADPSGRARRTERYDARGNRVETAYFDAEGAPTAYYGHVESTAAYDETDRLTKGVYVIPCGGSDLLQKSFVFVNDKSPTVRFESTEPDGKVQLNEAFVLQYRMDVRETCRYTTVIRQGDGREIRLNVLQRCVRLNGDGSFEVVVDVPETHQTVTMTMARTGKVLRSSSENPPLQFFYPTHPVFIGETWRQELPLPLTNPFTTKPWIVPLTCRYLLKEIREQLGRRVARIQVQIPHTVVGIGSLVSVAITGNSELTFAIDEGILVGSTVFSEITYAVLDEVVKTRIEVSVNLNPE